MKQELITKLEETVIIGLQNGINAICEYGNKLLLKQKKDDFIIYRLSFKKYSKGIPSMMKYLILQIRNSISVIHINNQEDFRWK